MKFLLFELALVTLALMHSAHAMRKQGYAVSGRFVCGNIPPEFNTTKVKLVDIDTGPDPDDLLEEKFIDRSGSFRVKGFTRELTDIDPVLYIWTDCNDGNTPCQRKIKFWLPKTFIVKEEPKPSEWFDFGTINLQNVFAEEKRECIKN